VRNRGVLLGGVAICWLAALPVHGDDDGARFAALLRDVAPSVVTVKIVTKSTVESGGKSVDHETRYEIPGVMVDGSGLILTSIMPFAPEHLMKLVMGGREGSVPDIKTVPGDIEVLFGQNEKENSAFLAATDSNLGLAFLQLEPLADQKPKAVDFAHPGTLAVGDQIAVVSRLAKGYDSAPYFETARISGEISKPRQAWTTDHQISALGLPVFSPAGRVVGILATVDSGISEADAPSGGGLSRGIEALVGGGGLLRVFVLPAPAVAAVIDQARQQAAQKSAARAAKKAAAPPAPGKS
jgi:hypothetical protein